MPLDVTQPPYLGLQTVDLASGGRVAGHAAMIGRGELGSAVSSPFDDSEAAPDQQAPDDGDHEPADDDDCNYRHPVRHVTNVACCSDGSGEGSLVRGRAAN